MITADVERTAQGCMACVFDDDRLLWQSDEWQPFEDAMNLAMKQAAMLQVVPGRG